MGYQALLFCPDEKLARVVTQVFTDLDFQVEAVIEPFGAVKKLMAQRYDAVVVDCENEQNATLLFKSARNSSSNQSSLALALVEGQAGVAKAYRIGANLVLTKPINVEQAKGTLRVARGLLRKNADAAAPAATPAGTPRPAAAPKPAAPAPTSARPLSTTVEPAKTGSTFDASPVFESALPAMAASAENEIFVEEPAAEPTMQAATPTVVPEPPKAVTATASIPAPVKPAVQPSISHGAAAATAPAKEAPSIPERKKTEPDLFETHETASPAISAPTRSAESHSAPAFAALNDSHRSEGSGGNTKMIAIAAAIVIAAGLGYVGWTKFGKTAGTPAQPVAVTPAPSPSSTFSTPSSTPANNATEALTPTTQSAPAPAPVAAKPSASVNTSAANKVAAAVEPVVTKPEPTPIRVKTQPSTSRPKAVAEEPAAAVPNPLGVAGANDKGLSLVASAPVNIPRPAPGMLKISQGVSQGLLINRVQPRYPSNALAMRIQGAVQLEATISKEGKITNLKPTSGDPVLARAAMDAVRQWRYKPYFLDGEPVDIQTQITVNFKLPN
jgi:periplasmic protein TonB